MQNYHLSQISRCFTLKQLHVFLFLCIFSVFMIFEFKCRGIAVLSFEIIL